MNKIKIIWLILETSVFLMGAAIIVCGFADIALPKSVWLLFAVLIIVNFHKKN